ncbi:MAG: hypothetical protein L0H83_08575, partial [Salinisphaera sp.]|nr:hypothetical protein [Salinisphaera sp.]
MAITDSSGRVRRLFAGDGEELSNVAQQLYRLRYAAIAAQLATVLLVQYAVGIDLPLTRIGVVILLLGLCNAGIGLRLRGPLSVSEPELFAHLLVDVAALTALLYYSGGSANPFVSLYLLPLIVAAVTLPTRFAAAMAAVTLVCYSALMFDHWPLPLHRFNLHVLGMWFNFLVSAGLILGLVVRMAHGLRRRDAALANAREQALRDEQIVALGALAAGAAHDLGTPLATMAVLARETEQQTHKQPELAANMRCLRDQIDTCKKTLARLRSYDVEDGCRTSLPADGFLQRIVEDWRRLRPKVPASCRWQGAAPMLQVETALVQTLTNLINNAADASPGGVDIEGCLDG